jgi:transcriptional regulator with XRE-family HTH domain
VSRNSNSIVTDNPWFAENLFHQLKQQGISVIQLAEWLNIRRQAIYQWREGTWPTDENFEALCVCLQCQPDDLLTKQVRDNIEMLSLSAWAKREEIPMARARDLFDLRILNGETRTRTSILVPAHLKAPEDGKQLVLMAKVPRWVPMFQENFPRLLKNAKSKYKPQPIMVVVGEAAGVKPSAVIHWAKQRNYPKEERLTKIAKVLGVTMRELVGDIQL